LEINSMLDIDRNGLDVVFVLADLNQNFSNVFATGEETESFLDVVGSKHCCLQWLDDSSINVFLYEL
jgi:hypothetical protein